MEESRKDETDRILKWIGVLTFIISAAWTYYKYRQDRTLDLENKRQELNSYIFHRQADLYFEAAKTAATLANETDPKLQLPARKRLDELYWGELVLVEDRRVELAMIAFYNCLQSDDKDCSRASADEHGRPLPEARRKGFDVNLHNLSLELAACMRTALERDRSIQFGNTANATTSCPYD